MTFHFGSVGIAETVPGIHISIWLRDPARGRLHVVVGILIGLPTLRLRGDYLAIVTLGFGEIIPQVVRNGDNVVRLRPHARHVRDQPDRLARLRQHR